MATDCKYFAIFGDVHGHFRLMFQLCRHWQLKHQVHLDGILLCGDIGFFPNITGLDKATKRYAKRDPEELGFALYLGPSATHGVHRDKQLQTTLLGDAEDLNTVRCPAIFCHGNHEDFEALSQTVGNQTLAPVDFYRRIYFLQSGEITELAGLRIAALGGAKERENTPAEPCLGPYVDPDAASRLLGQSFDVLLTHCGPSGATGEGSDLIQIVIEECQPWYHFYGHHRAPIPSCRIGRTQCYWHNDVNFQKVRGEYQGPPEPGCMGLLCWRGPEDHHYELVDGEWFRSITRNTWRHG